MKKLCLFFTFQFLLFTLKAQINLVSNSSFEEYTSCPNNYGQIDSAIGWRTPINGGGGNPELYNSCSSNPNVSVPSNLSNLSFQYAKSGQAYAGIDVLMSNQPNNYREYIQNKLNQKLILGKDYCICFYANLQNSSEAYITKLGAYLDNGNVSASGNHGLAIATPQVYSQQPLSDSINWTRIEGSFTSSGVEEYITIGNFFTDANSGVGFFGSPSFWYSYYYIDDVSVIDISTPAFAGNDTSIALGDSVFIGRQPEIGLNDDCIWFVNGNPRDTIAGMWVMPDTTTTYVLQQTICGTVNYDTVTVMVDPVGDRKLKAKGSEITIYPNPNNGKFLLQNTESNNIITITNILGETIYTICTTSNITEIDLNGHSKGVYFVTIIANDYTLSRTLVIE